MCFYSTHNRGIVCSSFVKISFTKIFFTFFSSSITIFYVCVPHQDFLHLLFFLTKLSFTFFFSSIKIFFIFSFPAKISSIFFSSSTKIFFTFFCSSTRILFTFFPYSTMIFFTSFLPPRRFPVFFFAPFSGSFSSSFPVKICFNFFFPQRSQI